MNFDNLKKMTREQLMEVAGKQGIHVHWKAKSETIIKQIMDNTLVPQTTVTPELSHQAAKPQVHVDNNSIEDIENAIASIKRRVPEFEAKYNESENTVHFRCKGAEECLNLSIPLRVIVNKANIISRGRLVPRGLNQHFDALNVSGNNTYTNTVLAG